MRRLPGLDLLRALAILWVMLSHAQLFDIVSDANPVASFGWMGVDLFFALSGFLIGGQLFRPIARQEPEHWGLFYARRLLRTLPPYLVVVALYFTVPIFRERRAIQPLWQFLTFSENLFIDLSQAKAFSHVWSLCVEEHFYLIAPIVVWLLARRPAAWKAVAVCGAILLGGMALRGYIWVHDLAPIQHIAGGAGKFYQRWQERIYYPTWTRLDGLLGGVVVAMIKAFRPMVWDGLMRRANLATGAGLATIALAIGLFTHERALIPTVIGFPILAAGMACLVAAGASPHGLIGRLSIPGAGAVAAMAYSLYLTHKQVFHMVQLVVGRRLDGHPVSQMLLYGGAALAAGALLYWAVERPAIRLRDRFLGARRTTREARPAPGGVEPVATTSAPPWR